MENKLYIVITEAFDFTEYSSLKRHKVFKSYESAQEHYTREIQCIKAEIGDVMRGCSEWMTSKELCYSNKDFTAEDKRYTISLTFNMTDDSQLTFLANHVTPELNFMWSCNPLRPLIKNCIKENISIINDVKFATIELQSINVED